MGRQERPLEPSDGTLEAFASNLRKLRNAAGNPSYRTLARKAGYSASALSTAASGRIVPSLAVTLAYAGACGGDLAEWERHWEQLQEVLASQGQPDPSATDEAGAEYGTAADDAAVPRPVPRELPPDVYGFTGRGEELAVLDDLLAAHGQGPAVVVAAISGTGGVGKTALAVHWAHRVADQFPDGQLYVDLHGYDPDHPAQPGDALAAFLRALGVGSDQLPVDVDERAALYRSMVAGRRILLVLDNGHSATQVRPLLPGTPSCLAIVTSRDSLAGLVARDGARRIDLELLPRAQALDLLHTLVGERVAAEPDAAVALVEHCARLPLALRIAAELAVGRPAMRLSNLVAELTGQRSLDRFDAGSDARTALRAVFSWSYQHLPAEAARAFRLLGPHPGPDADRYAAAALLGGEAYQAARLIDHLERAHLVQPSGHGRIGMHDLLREYAVERAEEQESVPERRAALTRLLDYYISAAAAAMDTLYPHERLRRPKIAPRPDLSVPALTEPAAARAWLDSERPNLVAVTAMAAQHGWRTHAGTLAAVVWRYLYSGAHHDEALAIHGHALRAAREDGDRIGEAAALHNIGRVYWRWGRQTEPLVHYEQALALYREVGDTFQIVAVLNSLGNLFDLLGRFDEAVDVYKEALAIVRDGEDRAGEASTLGNLAIVYEVMGRQDESIEYHEQALVIFREVGDHGGVGRTLDNLGSVLYRQGRYAEALRHHEEALAILHEIGDRASEAETLNGLGRAHLRLGHHDEALDCFEQAYALAGSIDNRIRQTSALVGLGDTLRCSGETEYAMDRYTAALRMARETGDRYEEAHALEGVGHIVLGRGQAQLAREHWTQALEIYTELDIPETEQVRRLLESLTY
jgi:tetratricopeptide (TPR) repeat protein